MAADILDTVNEIFESAFQWAGVENRPGWPSPTIRMSWTNRALIEIQRMTGFYRRRVTTAFAEAATYYEFTSQDPHLFKLLEVKNPTSVMAYEVTDLETLMRCRYDAALIGTTTATGQTAYVFALNTEPVDQVFGVVRVEAYPAIGTGGASFEVLYESAPPAVTALTETPQMPVDLIEPFIAWRIAMRHAPEKAGMFRAAFEGLCRGAVAARNVSKRSMPGVCKGFLADARWRASR
jgi:hypothetical protein